MTLARTFATAQEIVDRVKLHLPIHVTLIDPVGNTEFTIYRENVLRSLVIDAGDIVADAQMLAGQYGEMARAQRACERAAAAGERAFVSWKAQVAASARADAKKAGVVKITGAEAEEAYRTHPDYQKMADVQAYYSTLAGLFEDLKKGFDLKAKMVDATMRFLGGDMRMRKAEDTAELERAAAESIERSRGGRGRSPSE